MLLDSFTHAQEIERDYYDSGHLKFEGIYVENEDDIIANYRSYFKTADLETRLVTVPGKQGLRCPRLIVDETYYGKRKACRWLRI